MVEANRGLRDEWGASYPIAPVSMDMSSTGIVGSSRNLESTVERSAKGTRPSIRSDGISLAQSISVRMSRVDRHDVKTMLVSLD